MATKKKMLQAAAGNAGGAGLNVEEVFSTYLYEGNGSTQTITNDIDLDGEGGLVWLKGRNNGNSHYLHDSERTITKWLQSQTTAAEQTNGPVTSFNSDGFSLGFGQGNGGANSSGDTFASWTFRKAPKFFDVVTWTGTGSAQNISHSLGSVPGMILVCNTGSGANWGVYHRQLNNGTDRGHWRIQLNTTSAEVNQSTFWNDTAPTDSVFTVGSNAATNDTDNTYVAYLFAHNDGDGEFGADGDADIIKCGSYTGNNSGVEIDLGFEPQWFMCKKTNGGSDWQIFDTMRGMHFGTTTQSVRLSPNTSGAETSQLIIGPSPTGVSIPDASDSVNINGGNYIYIAIRRGTKVPESADEVFAGVKSINPGDPTFISGFPVDMSIHKDTTGGETINGARLIQNRKLSINTTAAEGSGNDEMMYDAMNGFYSPLDYGSPPGAIGSTNFISWMWKRAPGYFDVVTYSGNSTSGRTVSHNLGVAPEMIWFKKRSAGVNWLVHHKDLTGSYPSSRNYLSLNLSSNQSTTYQALTTAPTESSMSLSSQSIVNASGDTYIAYLFASLDGISKVGSYTGNDGTQTIDCGFTTGARFILIKQTSGRNWYIWDTERGINVASDPFLALNNTDSEEPGQDEIDAHASGFIINSPGGSGDAEINKSGKTYIFYAIA